ncbi:hypothetical protein N0V88_003970 [Collariella sp. IMI 366227]|nr:hypothetical protein N0V88_003970 [Collariella sp. IMI 366227]
MITCKLHEAILQTTNGTVATNSTLQVRGHLDHGFNCGLHHGIHRRGDCSTMQVTSGDSCATLANKCGISGAEFTKYNPEDTFCSSLSPSSTSAAPVEIFLTSGPKPDADGLCSTYTIKTDDNCANLGAEFDLTNEENGCSLLFTGTVLCLSTGTTPLPTPFANAVCGLQKLGSASPTDGSKIADLNPCKLNACCNIWGQCGITKDFCIDTNTGAPGTAKLATYGCISNCGVDIVKGDGTGAIKIGYFEGYNLGREHLFQDATQIDTSRFSHIHFAFGVLTEGF